MTLHTLRPDGFMYLESRSGAASLLTKGFELTDGSLALNVEAPIGEARAQVHVQTDAVPGDPPPVQQVAEGSRPRSAGRSRATACAGRPPGAAAGTWTS